MQLPCKRTRSQSPPFDLTFASTLTEQEPAATSTSSKRFSKFTTNLKRISTTNSNRLHSSQPSTPPSTPSLSRCSSSSSDSISILDLTQMAQPSLTLTPPPSPRPSRAPTSPSALHEQARRIFETHYVLTDSSSSTPSPPSSPTLIALDGSAPLERRAPNQGTTVQECTVM